MPDNIRYLIRKGLYSVTLPSTLTLFAPVVATAIWIVRKGQFLIWPLFAAMIAGVILSYFVYRKCSRRWLEWALGQASDLPKFKRKAIQHNLIAERGSALLTTESMLETELAQRLQNIDEQIAQQDDLTIPPEILFEEETHYRQTAFIAFGFFALAAMILMLFTPQRQWTQLINFTPLLGIGLYFFAKTEKKKFLARIDDKGIWVPEQYWPWENIRQTHYRTKYHGSSSAGRHGAPSHRYTSRTLTIIFHDGQQEIISLTKASKKTDMAEYLAVYRYRHSKKQS